jgi:hypothetical protein
MTLQAEEIESGAFLSLDDIVRRAQAEPFTPDSVYVLSRYRGEATSAFRH